jgi:hypothetical protein
VSCEPKPPEPVDDGRTTAKIVAELWQQQGMPSLGPHSTALSVLLALLLSRDPSMPAMTLTFEFQAGAKLREYTWRDEEGRLLRCTAFRPDGTVIEEPQIEDCGDQIT